VRTTAQPVEIQPVDFHSEARFINRELSWLAFNERVLAELAVRPPSAIEDELYEAGREELIDRLRHLTEGIANVLLIGHNPGLHELAVALADPNSAGFRMLESGKFPTAARASFRIPDHWSALGCSRYELVDYVAAESLRKDKD